VQNYNGDVLQAMAENPDLDFLSPRNVGDDGRIRSFAGIGFARIKDEAANTRGFPASWQCGGVDAFPVPIPPRPLAAKAAHGRHIFSGHIVDIH
jgi:hypothetical protein